MRTRDQLPKGALFVGCIALDDRDYARDYADGRRSAFHDVADAMELYVVETPASMAGFAAVYLATPTEREREHIAEGLARFGAAAAADPSLRVRFVEPQCTEVA